MTACFMIVPLVNDRKTGDVCNAKDEDSAAQCAQADADVLEHIIDRLALAVL